MSDRRALESLLSFWSLAGVDTALADGPVDRTARPAEPTPLARRAAGPMAAEGPALGAKAPAPSPTADRGGLEEARRLAAQAADAVVPAAGDGRVPVAAAETVIGVHGAAMAVATGAAKAASCWRT